MEKQTKIKFAFFGTPDRAVMALEAMKKQGVVPELVITQPNRPQGRKFLLTPPPVKIWAENHGLPVLQPEDLSDKDFKETLVTGNFDFFIVVAYGKILKQELLDMPKFGALNLHASLLPKLRGSSPIESAILLDEKNTGVTVIKMDKLMDHGPIVSQEQIPLSFWPMPADDLAKIILPRGGELLVKAMKGLVEGTIKPVEQDHSKATLTKKIEKEDGLIDLASNGYENFLKYNAYMDWPGIYFFTEKKGRKIRVKITEAVFENDQFVIKKVIPEGKKEMTFSEFNQR